MEEICVHLWVRDEKRTERQKQNENVEENLSVARVWEKITRKWKVCCLVWHDNKIKRKGRCLGWCGSEEG